MIRIFIFLLTFLSASIVSATAEDSYEDWVDRLVDVTEGPTRQIATESLENYSRDVATAIVRENQDIPEQAQEPLAKEIYEFLMLELFDNPEMKKIKYEIYREHFNLQELKELVSFYETDIGRKVITEFVIIAQKAQERAPTVSTAMQENLNANIGNIIEKVARENGW